MDIIRIKNWKFKSIEIIEEEKPYKYLRLNLRFLYWHLWILANWNIFIFYNDYHKINKLPNGIMSIYEIKYLLRRNNKIPNI